MKSFFQKLWIFISVFVVIAALTIFIITNNQPKNKFLKDLNVESCEDLPDKKNKAEYFFEASRHDFGLCTPQDFAKAAYYYEKSIQSHELLIASELRLALIYKYDPGNVKDVKRANFLFKQVAIYTSSFKDDWTKEQIENYLKQYFFDEKLPKPLRKEMKWMRHFVQKSAHERKYAAQKLKDQGFQGTEFLVGI